MASSRSTYSSARALCKHMFSVINLSISDFKAGSPLRHSSARTLTVFSLWKISAPETYFIASPQILSSLSLNGFIKILVSRSHHQFYTIQLISIAGPRIIVDSHYVSLWKSLSYSLHHSFSGDVVRQTGKRLQTRYIGARRLLYAVRSFHP